MDGLDSTPIERGEPVNRAWLEVLRQRRGGSTAAPGPRTPRATPVRWRSSAPTRSRT